MGGSDAVSLGDLISFDVGVRINQHVVLLLGWWLRMRMGKVVGGSGKRGMLGGRDDGRVLVRRRSG